MKIRKNQVVRVSGILDVMGVPVESNFERYDRGKYYAWICAARAELLYALAVTLVDWGDYESQIGVQVYRSSHGDERGFRLECWQITDDDAVCYSLEVTISGRVSGRDVAGLWFCVSSIKLNNEIMLQSLLNEKGRCDRFNFSLADRKRLLAQERLSREELLKKLSEWGMSVSDLQLSLLERGGDQ